MSRIATPFEYLAARHINQISITYIFVIISISLPAYLRKMLLAVDFRILNFIKYFSVEPLTRFLIKFHALRNSSRGWFLLHHVTLTQKNIDNDGFIKTWTS